MIVIDVLGDGEEVQTTQITVDDTEKKALERQQYFEWLRRSPQLEIVPVEEKR